MESDPGAPAPATIGGRSPAAAASAAFVGRVAEMEALTAGLDGAFAGRGGLYLVSGEPGIGKSRLADELAATGRARGARVLWGRCWEAGGAPPYWPWVQSIRSYLREADLARVRSEMGARAADLARMLPEIAELFGDLPEPPSVDAETARFRLFDATTEFLKQAAAERPLVVILDDLHVADTPSLLLLQFLASELQDARIQVVGAYRDTELDPGHPLAAAVVDLSRLTSTRRLPLGGIAEADVAALIEVTTGGTASTGAVAAIRSHTEGNPLFVGEVVRLLHAEGGLEGAGATLGIAVPAGVREVIARRLARLSGECVEALTMAAILGREFDLAELERVTALSTDRLLDLLEEAAVARVVTDVPGLVGRLRFSHALVRDTLYDEIPVARRVRLHARVGATLEEFYRQDLNEHLPKLAHHFLLAAPAGEADRAIRYAWLAGERAVRSLAYEEAVRLFEMALRAVELKRPVDERTRCDLLLALGDARTRAGQEEQAKRAFLRAATIAERLGAADRLASAALGYGGRFVWARAGTDERLVPLLERALAALGEQESAIRARVMARLAGALRDQPAREPRQGLSAEALGMARRIGDPETVAYALDGRYAVLLWPENPEERITVADELERVAESIGDLEKAVQARCYRTIALLELGDLHAVNSQLIAADALARELGQRAQIWLVTAMRATVALFQGRFEDGERLIDEALRAGERAQRSDAVLSHRIHRFTLHRYRGGLERLEEDIRRSIDEYPARPMFRCMLAVLLYETGRREDAKAVFEDLAADGFAAIPRSNEWLFSLGMLAEMVHGLADQDRAATLSGLLEPFARYNGATADYICTGPVSRSLGLLAAALARWDEASRWFDDALAASRRMNARPLIAQTLVDRAEMLLRRGRRGDRDEAAHHLGEARVLAPALGMDPLERRILDLVEEEGLAGAGAREGGPVAAAAAPNRFRRQGDSWIITYEGATIRIRDLKGLHYLGRLLAEPAREFHVLDLVAAERGLPPTGPEIRDADLDLVPVTDAGTVLDPQAKSQFRQRLRDLEEEVEEARGFGDQERVAGLEAEREFLIQELARAVGLGGRDRRAASDAERARVSVTRAIRAALARIAEHAPALGAHLQRTVRTGTFCSYQPDPRAPAGWET